MGQFFLTCNAMEHGRARGMMPLVKYFLLITLWITGDPRLMRLVRYFLPIRLSIARQPGLTRLGKSEDCYVWQDRYRWNHQMLKGWSYRKPDALWRLYLLQLFVVVGLLDLQLFFILFVHVNTGNSVPAVFLWPSSAIVSLHVFFSLQWFGPETIEHD